MTVSRRLLLVALLCLLPSLAAGLFTQFDLRARRTAELGQLAMRHAELSSSNLTAILDAARQVGLLVGMLPSVQALQPTCAVPLRDLHAKLARYAFAAVYDVGGQLVCGSRSGLATGPNWYWDIGAATSTRVGHIARDPGINGPFLPIGIPLTAADGARRGTVVVALGDRKSVV